MQCVMPQPPLCLASDSPFQVATELRGLILQLYESHLSADGFSVSYGRMARDPLFQQYVAATAELQKVSFTKTVLTGT